jgi:hypothetical protein
MTIPLVVQGLVETEDGVVFGLDTCKGSAWLEVNDSFRYERIGAKKGYTARKETKKGGDYWYGYRKVAGKLHKRYIGKTAELSIAKLDEIAEALDIPQQSRVIDKARETVIHIFDDDMLTTLQLKVQLLQKALEASLAGRSEKSGMINSSESSKLNTEVTESELQTELGNLKAEKESLRQDLAEVFSKVRSVTFTDKTWQRLAAVAEKTGKSKNDFLESLLQGNNSFIGTVAVQTQPFMEIVVSETKADGVKITQQLESHIFQLMETVQLELETLKQELANARADYIKLLENSIHITSKLRQEVQGLLVELEAQITSCDELREELEDKELVCVQLQSQLETERSSREKIEARLSEKEQNSARVATVSKKSTADATTILSQLRAKRKKSPVSLADIEAILEILEES